MRKKKASASDPGSEGEVWAKVTSHRSSYYISRTDVDDKSYIDDEAEVELLAKIDAISTSQAKHLGQDMAVSLLAAERYSPNETTSSPFFGSVNLRGSRRSALAYLPAIPFWALPQLIHAREVWLCVGWTFMKRGSADLASLFIGDADDRERLLQLGGNRLVVAPRGKGGFAELAPQAR